MGRDPESYYAALGVPFNATAAEIKTAFRRLSKELHPDRNTAPNASAQFQRIAEAYGCLSDPARRSAYDALGIEEAGRRSATLEPVRCGRCNKITAQPRYVVFRRVASFFTRTVTTPVQGIFCADCAGKEAVRSSAISAAFGWWGVPFGPFLTIKEIITNAMGGQRPAGAEQRLLWINALAFYGLGNAKLAYGLARRVQTLPGDELATHASELVADLAQRGMIRELSSLKSPWGLRPERILAQLVMGAVVPIAIAALVISAQRSSATQGGYHPSAEPQVATAGPPVTLALSTAPTRLAVAQNGMQPLAPAGSPVTIVSSTASTPLGALENGVQAERATCANTPSSGSLLGGQAPNSAPGNRLTIKNGSEGPVIVKVRHDPERTLAFSFFVAKGESATVGQIPDGTYRIQYALGEYLNDDCRSLGGLHTLAELPDADTLATRTEGDQLVTSALTYTLYPVVFGNVRPQQITAAEFNAS